MSTCTFFATGIGSLPILDIALPHVTDDFAADAAPPCVLTRHHALRCRKNRDTEPAVHARDLPLLYVHPQPRLAHALQARQHRLFLPGVVQVDAQSFRAPSSCISNSRMNPSFRSTVAIATSSLRPGCSRTRAWPSPRCGSASACPRLGPSCSRLPPPRSPALSAAPRRPSYGKAFRPAVLYQLDFITPGRLPLQRVPPETDPAQREVPDVRPRPSAELAAVLLPRRILRLPIRLDDHRCLRHGYPRSFENGMPINSSSRCPSSSVPAS